MTPQLPRSGGDPLPAGKSGLALPQLFSLPPGWWAKAGIAMATTIAAMSATDEVIHTYNFFALTLLAAVYAYGVILTGAREHGLILVLAATVFGLGLGALWEMLEFAYDHFIVKPNAILPKRDTIIDMALDTTGALVAGLVLLGMLRR